MQEDEFFDDPPAYEDAAAYHHPEDWVDASSATPPPAPVTIYSRAGVYVHPSSDRMERIGGILSLLEEPDESLVLTWTPNFMMDSNDASAHARSRLSHKYAIQVAFRDIVSIHKTEPKLGYTYPHITITVRQGATFPPFYFHDGGLREFINMAAQYVRLTQAPGNPQLLLVNDVSTHLSRTLSELHVSTPGVIATPSDTLTSSALSPPAPVMGDASSSRTATVGSPGGDAPLSFLERFARVTQIARETTAQILENNGGSQRARRQLRPLPDFPPPPPPAAAEPPPPPPRRSSLSPAPSAVAEPVTDTCDVGPLTAPLWFSLFDEEGRLDDAAALTVRRHVFYGGVENDIRPTVWKYLLGVYPWMSTEIERTVIDEQCIETYNVLHSQWSTILPAQEANFAKFRERKHLIEKDVARTDRRQPFYVDEDGPNCRALREMLITYTFYDFDIGYVQGMSDLLAPIFAVVQDKPGAFWCFVNLMKRMRGNFHKDQHGMNGHLALLRTLLRVVDPQFMAYLEANDAVNMYFCYRWMLIDYKREFPFHQVMRLWEAIWSNYLTDSLSAFIAMAILRAHRDVIMSNGMEFDDILKYINDLAQTLDVEQVLRDTCKVYRDLQERTDLPPEVAALLNGPAAH